MMFWNELGLEPTDDIKKIKQSYSRKLKTIDRKLDIEGFQRLHKAYQAALAAAETGEKEGSEAPLRPVFEPSPLTSESPVQPPSFRNPAVPEAALEPESSRLAEAIEGFFQEIARYPEIDCIHDAYMRLRDRFSLGRDLLGEDRMDSFLHELHMFLKQNPNCADTRLVEGIFRDLQLVQDIRLYQEYEYAIRRIRSFVQLEAARSAWVNHVDPRAARILLDQDPEAGYRERHQRHVLARIMEAIGKLETECSLLIGPYVAAEKIKFWKNINRSVLITQDDLVNALWGFLLVPGLYAALTLKDPEHVISLAMAVISYPLALIYICFAKRLRFAIEDSLGLRILLDRQDLRIAVIAVNAIYAFGALMMDPQADGHVLSVLGLISLFLVLIRTMPFGILGFGTLLGSLVLTFVQPSSRTLDLALAAQLGTGLFFLLVAAQGYSKILWNRWRPEPAEPRPQKVKGPSLFTMRNIVFAIIFMKVLVALSQLRF